ncbi:hypothetical protein SAMN07250955_11677 [Arboricoccus pini]|uniref:Uncharacterized protein n=1 Tax=Arboricoccus pini TaxID=1963835 RepID=A0A212RXB0_9PROT|nr:hypothetical protein SAMN07250955_11677 [Arboricoccus pini]
MAASMMPRRRSNGLSFGPLICQRLVTSEGNSRSVAAALGATRLPRMAIATVGKPMPVTPLTMPATTKVTETSNDKER